MAQAALLYGWTGAANIRLSVLWGYTDRYEEHEESMGPGVGNWDLTFSAVPAGEVWVVTSFAAYASTDGPDRIRVVAHCGSDGIVLRQRAYSVAWDTVEMPGQVVLEAGDYLIATFDGCLIGDNLYANANGYKMSVA